MKSANPALDLLNEPVMRMQFLTQLRRGKSTKKMLREQFNIGKEDLDGVLEGLEEAGYMIGTHGHRVLLRKIRKPQMNAIKVDNHFVGGKTTFGFVSDTHLCSKYQRLDALELAYDEFANRGVKQVFHGGNLVDGESDKNRHELLVHGLADQAGYALDNYPQRSGICTFFVDADDHEGWWTKEIGIEFGRYLHLAARASGRNDLQYLGYLEADVEFPAKKDKTILRVMHPGGGSAHAKSWTAQKIVRTLQPGDKPHILLLGHFHKAEYTPERMVHVVQGGCTQDQTTFMRKKMLAAEVGFWIISFQVDSFGVVTRFVPEWYPFYDKGYYGKRDK